MVVDSTILVIHNYFNVFHMYKDEIIRNWPVKRHRITKTKHGMIMKEWVKCYILKCRDIMKNHRYELIRKFTISSFNWTFWMCVGVFWPLISTKPCDSSLVMNRIIFQFAQHSVMKKKRIRVSPCLVGVKKLCRVNDFISRTQASRGITSLHLLGLHIPPIRNWIQTDHLY